MNAEYEKPGSFSNFARRLRAEAAAETVHGDITWAKLLATDGVAARSIEGVIRARVATAEAALGLPRGTRGATNRVERLCGHLGRQTDAIFANEAPVAAIAAAGAGPRPEPGRQGPAVVPQVNTHPAAALDAARRMILGQQNAGNDADGGNEPERPPPANAAGGAGGNAGAGGEPEITPPATDRADGKNGTEDASGTNPPSSGAGGKPAGGGPQGGPGLDLSDEDRLLIAQIKSLQDGGLSAAEIRDRLAANVVIPRKPVAKSTPNAKNGPPASKQASKKRQSTLVFASPAEDEEHQLEEAISITDDDSASTPGKNVGKQRGKQAKKRKPASPTEDELEPGEEAEPEPTTRKKKRSKAVPEEVAEEETGGAELTDSSSEHLKVSD